MYSNAVHFVSKKLSSASQDHDTYGVAFVNDVGYRIAFVKVEANLQGGRALSPIIRENPGKLNDLYLIHHAINQIESNRIIDISVNNETERLTQGESFIRTVTIKNVSDTQTNANISSFTQYRYVLVTPDSSVISLAPGETTSINYTITVSEEAETFMAYVDFFVTLEKFSMNSGFPVAIQRIAKGGEIFPNDDLHL